MVRLLKASVISLILMVLILTVYGCYQDDSTIEALDQFKMPDNMPDDFQITYFFGVEQAEQHSGIDTQNKSIQKDLVLDGLVTSSFSINDEKLESIYDLLREIDIASYPSNYKPPYMENPPKDTERFVTPSFVYDLWIQYDGNEYSLYWHDSNASEIDEAVELRKCLEEIKTIIRSLEAYKELGEPNGGYD